MEKQLPDQATLQNLEDAGCDAETVRCYCECAKQAEKTPLAKREQMRLLTLYRRDLLKQLHECQRRLDCLDHLLYQLREQNGCGCGCGEKEDGHD